MALLTVFPECVLMYIRMTGVTILIKAEKSFLPFFKFCIGDKFFSVTVAALNYTMLTCQGISGFLVVKLFFIKPHNLKRSAMMLTVAAPTVFSFYF